MSRLDEVNDDKNIAAGLLGNKIDYLGFIEGIRHLQSKNNANLDRISLVKSIHELKNKYSK